MNFGLGLEWEFKNKYLWEKYMVGQEMLYVDIKYLYEQLYQKKREKLEAFTTLDSDQFQKL